MSILKDVLSFASGNTARKKSSNSSSMDVYDYIERKAREEEEEKARRRYEEAKREREAEIQRQEDAKRQQEEQRKQQEEAQRQQEEQKREEDQNKQEVLPKANEENSNKYTIEANNKKIEDLQKQLQSAGNNVNKVRELGTQIKNLKDENDRLQNPEKYQTDVSRTFENLGLGLKKGLMNFSESGVSAINRTYSDRDKMMDIMTSNVNKIREEKGFEPLPTAEESRKIILGDSYNKDLFGRDKEDQQKKWEEKKNNIDTKIASNIENTDSVVGKKLAEIAPSIGNQLPGYVLPGGAGLVYFTGSAKGAYMEDAKARGMSDEEANTYSGIMAIAEGLTEQIGAGLTKNVGKKVIKGSSKEALKYFGLDVAENFIEEAVMEPISETTATLTGGSETANWDNMGKRMLNSGLDGALSSIIMSGTSAGIGKAVQLTNKINNNQQITQQEISEAVKETLESDKVNQEELKNLIKENTNEIIKQEITEIQEQKLPVATGENTYSNQLKQTATEEINNSNIPKSEKEMMLDVLNGMDAITDADLSAIRDTIEAIKETQQLDTKGQYKNDQARRQKYMQYKNDTNTYDSTVVNEVLDTIPENRNGRRTVKQWLTAADEIGKRIANLSNEEIEQIAYKSWFDLQPTKSITQYDNVAKKSVGFQKFTSDEWINNINKAVNEARANNQVQENTNELPVVNEENAVQTNINDKVQEYLDKTGLSSKMSVDEFINRAEKFTLENEENMTAEQQELYDIIKDIQNRDAVKEEIVDYDNGIWYNDEGIEYSNKFYEKQLDRAITTDTPNLEKNKLHIKEFGDNFYIFEKKDDGKYTKYLQLKIEGNEDIINFVEEAVKNGELTNIQKIHASIDEYWNRDTNSNGFNSSNEKQARENGQSGRFYREESKFDIRPDSKGSNENSNDKENLSVQESESNSGSFFMDNKGRTLTKEQQEYFKDSKVRDENGNLKTMYHGTDADFTEFTYDNYGKTGTAYGKGFYFTDSKEAGQAYGKNLKEVYLDIKKPMEIGKTTMSKAEFKKLVEEVNKATGGTVEADYGSIEDAVMEYDYGGDDIDLTNAIMSISGLKTEKFYEILRNTLGYDGIKANNKTNGKDGNYYLAFNSNQIKNIDNTNPTSNPDILKEQYTQLSIEGFNTEPENNLAKDNWSKYQEAKKKTNEVLKKEGTKVEIAKRKFSKDFVDNGYIDLNGKTINNAADIADAAQIFRNPKYETFRVIYMKGNTIVGQEAVSSKTPSETNVYVGNSQAKGLYKIQNRMERLGADGYYLIHNHPTGTAKASDADINTTKIISKKINGFLGHVIINSGTYALIENSKVQGFKDSLVWNDNIKIENYSADDIDRMMSKDLWANTQIKDRSDILNLAYDLKNNPNYSSLILTDAKQMPRMVLDIPNKFLNMKLGQINGYIRNVARQNGANNAYIATQDADTFDKMFFSNTLRDCILYSVDENGNLIAKQSKTKDSPGKSIFQTYNSMALRANEKIEDIYNSIFETNKQERSTYNTAPTKDNILATGEFTRQKTMNPTEIANINKESIIQKGEKQRKHYKSIMQSKYSSNEARTISKELMGTDTYVPESNNKQLERADERISIAGADSELNSLMSRAMTGGNIKADDIAVGERLIQYYSKIGNKEKLSEAIQATAMAGTTAGQTVQAMSLLNHQTPEGQAIWLQRSIEKMNNKLKSQRGDRSEQFKLTPEMTEKIVNSKNTEELQNNLNEVYEELGQQVSKSAIQKIDAWRYFAMLANPKTHIRNIVGNTAMSSAQSVKNKVAGVIEGTIAKFNPKMERNHTIIPVSKEVKEFAKSDIINVADRLGLNQNKYNPKTRLENSMRTFKSDAMENTMGKAFDLNDKALEAEDGWGLKSAYTRALSEYMTSNKLKPNTITDEKLSKARNYAIEQAKEATFHQESNLATLLNQLSNKNNFTKFVMDATLPFKKTPINVAKAGLEYSPVGLVKSAVYDTAQLRKGNITINKYIDNISKGLTGTGIALMGYALASCGVLKSSGSDDKDKEGFDEVRGNQTYSIKIGDNTYSLDWLSPVGIPLFIGAECYEIGQEAKKENTSSSDEDSMYNKIVESATNVLDSFTNAMNPMTEMSMLSGLTSAIKSYDGDNSKMLANIGVNAGKSYINQFVPTALSQIARTTDKYERNTISTKTGTLPKAIDSSKNYIMSKIPGLRQILPKKTDVWGNEVKQSENVLLRATENSLFPWTRKEISTNNVDNAILKVYESTGDNSVFPDSINKNMTINSKKYVMTSGEYAKYQQQYGKTSYTLLNNLVNSSSYKKMSEEQKQKSIENAYSYAKEQIKIDYAKQNKLEYEESTLSKTINAIKKVGGNTGNYLEYTALTKDLKKDSEKIELLANANYSINTKKAIYENTLGEDDITYKIVKDSFTESGLNISKYLNYKNQELSADRKDDGTVNGQPISGSKKTKVLNYIKNIPGATNTQKLLLYALQYEPDTRAEKQQVVNYIDSLTGYTNEEKLELLSKFKGVTIYKNGKYEY